MNPRARILRQHPDGQMLVTLFPITLGAALVFFAGAHILVAYGLTGHGNLGPDLLRGLGGLAALAALGCGGFLGVILVSPTKLGIHDLTASHFTHLDDERQWLARLTSGRVRVFDLEIGGWLGGLHPLRQGTCAVPRLSRKTGVVSAGDIWFVRTGGLCASPITPLLLRDGWTTEEINGFALAHEIAHLVEAMGQPLPPDGMATAREEAFSDLWALLALFGHDLQDIRRKGDSLARARRVHPLGTPHFTTPYIDDAMSALEALGDAWLAATIDEKRDLLKARVASVQATLLAAKPRHS